MERCVESIDDTPTRILVPSQGQEVRPANGLETLQLGASPSCSLGTPRYQVHTEESKHSNTQTQVLHAHISYLSYTYISNPSNPSIDYHVANRSSVK